MTQALDPRTPVLVGIGIVDQCEDDAARADEAVQLMIRAAHAAGEDCGRPDILPAVQRVGVPKGVWSYSDPARLVARAVDADATTILAEIGILQQSLFADACREILSGNVDVALVVGGEAKYRQLRASIAGIEVPETVQEEAPDIVLEPEQEIWSEVESAAGLGMPVGFYAIMESALRRALGEDVDAHRDRVAAMYERFAETARYNPHAWNREGMSATEIRDPSPKNKMLAFPYTKYHNSQWNVDQAGALLFCSAEKAQSLDIPREKWVFPLASTESNYMVNVSQRVELAGSEGARLAGREALALAGLSVEELDLLEMYSCFPSAVEIYARELGIPLERDLTVTGGMTFGGGPLNNFVLQSTCRMAELLREKPGSKGMVTSVSGMLTKQGFGVWSTEPNPSGFGFADVTEQARAASPPIPLVPAETGNGEILGYTVLYHGDAPLRAVAVIGLEDGKRTVAYCDDAAVMAAMMEDEYVGRSVAVDGGRFIVN